METCKPCPMACCQSFLMLLGRLALAVIFLLAAIGKFSNPTATQAYMALKGMSFTPFFMYAAAIIELIGALSLIFGYKTRWGATLLWLFLIPTTLIFHNFWAMQDPEKELQMLFFLKNLAIMGGLLYVSACGAGKFALDHLCCKKHDDQSHNEKETI